MTTIGSRDLIGYGRNPPHPCWPGEARICLQFVINFEEGAENSILHGDAASEAFLSEIVGAQPWPGLRHMSMESIYEYGSRAGFWRLLRLFTERRQPVTIFGVAAALSQNLEAVAAMKEAGWEIASHGLRWIDYKDFSYEEERAHLSEAIRIHAASTGERPLGWYTGRTSEHTLRIVNEDGGFLYSADSYADDLPYWVHENSRPLLIVPYTLDANDMRFATPQGFNSGDQFYSYLKDTFDLLYAEGAEAPKMMSVGLHCRLAGRPGRAAALARFLDYVSGHDKVWTARRLDVARHWISRGLPAGARPSALGKAMFVETFGAIFESSPWIAEAVYDVGLGSPEDSPEGLHRAMVSQLRCADRKLQLDLIRRHPELAPRAPISTLTAESRREQASAGLDSLDAAGRVKFQTLNNSYKMKFGFPFIMAVKNRASREILDAFEARLEGDPEQEFRQALAEIETIALLRLKEKL
jgi:OHCU decarboxylase